MPAIYPIDAFMCERPDYGRASHDYQDIVCHACFDALYPWTEKWDQCHSRIRGSTIYPGGDLEYAMVNGDSWEGIDITECECCHRIVFEADHQNAKDLLKNGSGFCSCRTCWPEPYLEDEAKVESGEYDRIRASNTAKAYTKQEMRLAARKESRRMREMYLRIGGRVPEQYKAKERKTG